jgi:hypothetical protein
MMFPLRKSPRLLARAPPFHSKPYDAQRPCEMKRSEALRSDPRPAAALARLNAKTSRMDVEEELNEFFEIIRQGREVSFQHYSLSSKTWRLVLPYCEKLASLSLRKAPFERPLKKQSKNASSRRLCNAILLLSFNLIARAD